MYYTSRLIGQLQASIETSYSNPGGIGDRQAIIVATSNAFYPGYPITRMINGYTGSTATQASWGGQACSGLWMKFDFGTGKVINEAKWYQSSIGSQGVWKWQGSNDDSSYTDIGTSFTLGIDSQPQIITALSANTTTYRYYKLQGVSGSTTSNYWLGEIEFKISA